VAGPLQQQQQQQQYLLSTVAVMPIYAAPSTQLWVDKYKPRSTADLVGNPSHVKTLSAWLRGWENVHLKGGQPLAVSGMMM
jgi:hypothetical protein